MNVLSQIKHRVDIEKAMEERTRIGDFQHVNLATIGIFHALLKSAPLGFMGGCGKPHVLGCNCQPCRHRKAHERKFGHGR